LTRGLKIFIFCILLVTSSAVEIYAQARVIDSLKLALKNAKHDTTRCNCYINLGYKSNSEHPDSAFFYWKKAQLLAEKNFSNTSSLKMFYLKTIGQAMGNIATVYQNKGEFPKALECYNKSLKIKEECGDKGEIAASLNNIGVIYVEQGEIAKAIDYWLKSLKIREEIGDKSGIASSLNNIGAVYQRQGDIPKALEYHGKSLKIREEIGDKSGIASSLNNIGVIYKEQGDMPKALEYHHKSLMIREEIGNKSGIAASLINIGNVYREKGDPLVTSSEKDALRAGKHKALEYYQKALKLKEEIGDKSGVALSLNNIGIIYRSLKQDSKALDSYSESLKIREEIGDKLGITQSLNNIGLIYHNLGKLKEGYAFAIRGFQVAKELGYPRYIKNSASLLKSIFLKQKKHKEAFEMYELEIKMRDSINNQETQKAAIKKQMQYTYEKQEEVAKAEHKKELEKQQAIAEEKNRRQIIVIGSVAIGLLLVIIFAGYVFKTLRVTRKQKVLIEIKNKETEHQKKEIEQKQKEILDSIHYARRIQMAQIPSEKQVSKSLERLRKG